MIQAKRLQLALEIAGIIMTSANGQFYSMPTNIKKHLKRYLINVLRLFILLNIEFLLKTGNDIKWYCNVKMHHHLKQV